MYRYPQPLHKVRALGRREYCYTISRVEELSAYVHLLIYLFIGNEFSPFFFPHRFRCRMCPRVKFFSLSSLSLAYFSIMSFSQTPSVGKSDACVLRVILGGGQVVGLTSLATAISQLASPLPQQMIHLPGNLGDFFGKETPSEASAWLRDLACDVEFMGDTDRARLQAAPGSGAPISPTGPTLFRSSRGPSRGFPLGWTRRGFQETELGGNNHRVHG